MFLHCPKDFLIARDSTQRLNWVNFMPRSRWGTEAADEIP